MDQDILCPSIWHSSTSTLHFLDRLLIFTNYVLLQACKTLSMYDVTGFKKMKLHKIYFGCPFISNYCILHFLWRENEHVAWGHGCPSRSSTCEVWLELDFIIPMQMIQRISLIMSYRRCTNWCKVMNVNVTHTCREGNYVADNFAKWCIDEKYKKVFLSFEVIPFFFFF